MRLRDFAAQCETLRQRATCIGVITCSYPFGSPARLMMLRLLGPVLGGELLAGRLLAAQFPGPAWLTGGSLGPEASLFVFPVFAVLFALFTIRHRQGTQPR